MTAMIPIFCPPAKIGHKTFAVMVRVFTWNTHCSTDELGCSRAGEASFAGQPPKAELLTQSRAAQSHRTPWKPPKSSYWQSEHPQVCWLTVFHCKGMGAFSFWMVSTLKTGSDVVLHFWTLLSSFPAWLPSSDSTWLAGNGTYLIQPPWEQPLPLRRKQYQHCSLCCCAPAGPGQGQERKQQNSLRKSIPLSSEPRQEALEVSQESFSNEISTQPYRSQTKLWRINALTSGSHSQTL